MKRLKLIFGLLGVTLLVVIDQITKIIAKSSLENSDGIPIIKGIFRLEYIENTGAAFGIMKDKYIVFVLLTVLVLVFIAFFYNKVPNTKKYIPMHIVLVCISAGAIGNMIDRILHNYVIDFLYFELINFPVFNVADCYVTVSAFALILLFLFYYKEEDFEFISRKKKIEQ
ncbi:signal peptidase II [Anaeromicropila herbilytica]|uniref:Lipoprotein signal peptidase n=1 Tax=Anaeromicropila herbilytica TaxID=2785025 RepID=A0A7R7ID46_9FIRM|nr:signal peptidase II [Anaeromicropila herbilytica]BCN31192.1 lipoprotein signal peptidase [Anaeromicropila herbilytica]